MPTIPELAPAAGHRRQDGGAVWLVDIHAADHDGGVSQALVAHRRTSRPAPSR